MDRLNIFFLVFLSVTSNCYCELSYELENKLLNGFIEFYNSLPDQIYACDEGYLQNAQQSTEMNSYNIEVTLKVSNSHKLDTIKYLRCKSKVVDLDRVRVSVLSHQCKESDQYEDKAELEEIVVTEATIQELAETSARKPVELDNEVQTDPTVTSGEQFIAIPRENSKTNCVECVNHVKTDAEGVSELVDMGIRQLDILIPGVEHSAGTVLDVIRQVQIINGVRYIVTFVVDYKNCSDAIIETCSGSMVCKITFLEKPWVKKNDGSKYRSILANNCTKQWLFGDDGMVVPPSAASGNSDTNEIHPGKNGDADIVKVHNEDVQARPLTQRTLTDDDIKIIEEQIVAKISEPQLVASTTTERSKDMDTEKQYYLNLNQPHNTEKDGMLSGDKRKAIDDMMNFFNFAGISPNNPSLPPKEKTRQKRSYETDLNVMNLVQTFQKLRKNIENAKHVYKLAQMVVDYVNEMDIEVKNRLLKEVVKAEEEFENNKHFIYIQARVTIPCDKYACEEEKDSLPKMCNAVVDATLEKVQILDAFCHDEPMDKPSGKIYSVQLDDQVLLQLVKEATNKIESKSTHSNAVKVIKVFDATTQRVSGILTRFSIIINYMDCNKTVPLVLRSNCAISEELGSQVCDVTVHEKQRPQDKMITYSCTERSIDTSFANLGKLSAKNRVNDPEILEMANEALQYLEVQSNRNNKQVVVKVNSVATQLVAGFLTEIEFVVGFTTCTNDVKNDNSKCKLLQDEPFKTCKAKVWDRTWLEDGRQVDVVCEDPNANPNKTGVQNLTETDKNNTKFNELAKEALRKYLKKSVYHRHYDLIEIIRASYTLDNGSLTELEFKISPTNCLTDSEGKPSSHDCKVLDYNDITICTSMIQEKESLGVKEIDTKCNVANRNTRIRRHIQDDKHTTAEKQVLPGGLVDQDPGLPEYKALAVESMKKYLTSNGITSPHKVIDVIKVTTQVVSGILTRIDFTILPVEHPNSGDVISCHSEVLEQPWLNNKDISVNCDIENRPRSKREHNMVGGQKIQDPSKPEYKALAVESMKKYLTSNGITSPHKVIEVIKVTTQVVSGILTRIDFTILPVEHPNSGDVISCHSEVLEQPWLNNKDISVNCDIENRPRSKREHDMVGGQDIQDPSKPEYKALAVESMKKYLTTNGITSPHKVIEVIKVTTQVVSGILTRIDFTILPVEHLNSGDVIICHSKILEQAWLNNKDISVNCDIENRPRSKREHIMGGGQEIQDPSKPEYKALAVESMKKYLTTNGITSPHKIIDVTKVTTQVVSGILTRIDFTILPVEHPNSGDVISCHSEVLEQPWLNNKDISVNCDIENRPRSKREHNMVGGQEIQDPSKPEYKALAVESLKKYITSNDITSPHKVIDVIKVTTQVVSGILTRIDFTILPVEHLNSGDVISCHSEILEQSWLNNKDISVNCDIENRPRSKREHDMVGGQEIQDPSKPEYKALAVESMKKYLKSKGITSPHKIIDVTKVTTQVVSGILTRIDFTILPVEHPNSGDVISCHSEILEQSWLNNKDISVNCDIENRPRSKRGLILGGQEIQDPSKPEYKALAVESMKKYLKSKGITSPHKIIDVTKVTTQVVSGILTRIDFTILPVEHPNSGDVISCHSEILEQSWLNNKDISVNCDIENRPRSKRGLILGGQEIQDPSKPEYKALAVESMKKYLKSKGITSPHKIIDVTKVTTQVVSGILTRIDFTILPVEHPNSGDVISCHSEILEQSWLNNKDISVNCDIENRPRSKRGLILGGQEIQDPSKPEYKALAVESMKKYLTSNGITSPHKVIEVIKVTTQVVSGILTRIDFTILPVEHPNSGDVISCHSEVLEQPWLNNKDISVNCDIENRPRSKREHDMVGGQDIQDPSKPEYKALAVESMKKYLTTNGITSPHKVIEVIKVTTQVVSGILTRIDFTILPVEHLNSGDVIICHSKILEQAWLNNKDISVNCDIENRPRSKREHIMGGGQEIQDPSKPEYKALAVESMKKYLTTNGITSPHKIIDVTKVTTQVVSGILTRIDFTILPVEHPNSGDVISCHSEVLEQPWLNNKDISVNCDIENRPRSKREHNMVGGQEIQDPSKPEYKALAVESLKKYITSNDITSPHKVIDVIKVTTQVVSGILTRIDFTILPVEHLNSGDVISCHSEILEQSWLNNKDISVNCDIENRPRSKREHDMVGGQEIQDPSKPEYKALAVESMKKYLKSKGITSPHKIIDVTKVTTQVVSGILTRIDFTILPVEHPNSGDVISCHSEILEQSWLNNKDISVNCDIENRPRSKRGLILGGQEIQDPSKPEYKALAVESMKKYLKSKGITSPHKIIDVTKVTTQVVSGILTRIDFTILPVEHPNSGDVISCHSEILEQSWLNNKDISVNCDIENRPRSKRGLILGGQEIQDPSKPEYKALAVESMKKYLKSKGITSPHKIIDVTKVTTQVVSGILTRIDFTILPVEHPNSGDVISCHSEILEQSWLNNKDISVNCDIENRPRSKRGLILGGQEIQDPSKPEYKALAVESMKKYLKSKGITSPHKIIDVTKVTTQVVSGILTRIDFTILPVEHPNSGDVISCHSEILEQSWLNNKDISVNCDIENRPRSKRGLILGGQEIQDPSKPEYKALAVESMKKYLKSKGITSAHKIIDVTKVTTQVVSGILTRIDFTILPVEHPNSGDVISCHSEILEQSWLNNKDISVNCDIENRPRSKRGLILGGQEIQDPSKPEYKALAVESMKKYLKSKGITSPHKIIDVTKVTTQVVSGILTRIDFTILPVEHPNSGDVISCHSEILEQSWLNNKDISVNCDIENRPRSKRGLILGGQEIQDPSKPEYKALAVESMKKYLKSKGITSPHKIIDVTKVTTQVVSGILTRIDFTILPVEHPNSGDVISCHSEILEQSWLNNKDISVNCDIENRPRSKRGLILGGQEIQDPSKPEYKALAVESMKKYLKSKGITSPHKIIDVTKVTTQVVSGILTRIDFTILPVEHPNSGDVISCHSEILEQSWLNNKDISVNCDIENRPRSKRGLILGGQEIQDPSKPEYKALAVESMKKYLKSKGITSPHKIIDVTKVTTQVVSGILTRIDFTILPVEHPNSGDVISCHSEILEQSWLNNKDISVNCDIENRPRSKRGLILGGQEIQDPSKPEYKALAVESMKKYLKSKGITSPHKIIDVTKVTTQVVSGILTRIDFTILPVEHPNSGDVISCHSEILEQSWLNNKDISVNCDIENRPRSKRGLILGGQEIQDPSKPEYKALAVESMKKYLKSKGITSPHKIIDVTKVTTQVVSGILTRIDFTILPVEHPNSGDVISCHSEILEQSWLNNKDISVNCDIENRPRSKRGLILGGQEIQDPSKPEYKALAVESMKKYLKSKGITSPHKIIDVTKVTTQVVSGILTRIDFTILPVEHPNSGDVISCHSEILEQSWLNNKDISVNCDIENRPRSKRGLILGGQEIQDPSKPEYKALAVESMKKYLKSKGITSPHKIIDVTKVTTQVVSGILTRIDFTILPVEHPNSGDVISCHSEILEQSWLNNKDISVNCDIENRPRSKRGLILGGQEIQDPSKPEYKALAVESMKKYLKSKGITSPHKIIDVTKVTTQVVSGILTRIDFTILPVEHSNSGDVISCHSEIWERRWLKIGNKIITVDCGVKNITRNKRQVGVKNKNVSSEAKVGGSQEQDPSKIEYKELAQLTLKRYLKREKISRRHIIVEVTKVKARIVSGIIYDIEYVASPKGCAHDPTACEDGHSALNCKAEVWDRPWLSKKDILSVNCKAKKRTSSELQLNDVEDTMSTDIRDKRQIDVDDDYIEDEVRFYYADAAIKKLNQIMRSNNLFKVITIHDVQHGISMSRHVVRMYLDVAETFCMRNRDENMLEECDELDGIRHGLCLARIYPSTDDEMVIEDVNIVCDEDARFKTVTGIEIAEYLLAALKVLEVKHGSKYKYVHQGYPQVIPSLNPSIPHLMNFLVAQTNCSANMRINEILKYNCVLDVTQPTRACRANIWKSDKSKKIRNIMVECDELKPRRRRSMSLSHVNSTTDELIIQSMLQEVMYKLEMQSANTYKQRVYQINSYSTNITSVKVTTIDFDVGYTSCMKYEWVDDISSCEFLEHVPRRHCIAQVYEQLWHKNGMNIEFNCKDDETPLEDRDEYDGTVTAMTLANEAIKHIEAKYPKPRKQKVVRVFGLEKQVVAGIHYRLKMEIGSTFCPALTAETNCKLDEKLQDQNRFCRVNIWIRPWTTHAPNFRVTCDYQENASSEEYHIIQAEQLFHSFVATYKPDYINNPQEMKKRFKIFRANVRKIHELNSHERGSATYGVTRFADLSYEEFSGKYMGLKPSLRDKNALPMRQADIPKVVIPENYDWRDFDAVTEVKDQGACGSCWAFSVTGNIEGQWQLQTGQLMSLSEQELIDCDKQDHGCNGGLMDNAYRAIEELGGLELENDYPYEGEDDHCSFNKTMSKVKISGAVNITANETDMAKWLVQNGPISIGINANAMQFYMGGVSHPWKMLCSPSNLDHGVLIVGYGIKDYPLFHKRLPYWTIKNSWGAGWGEQGYYRVYRGDGTCGVNQMASSAVL